MTIILERSTSQVAEPICLMCGTCCQNPPILRQCEMEDVKSALAPIGLHEDAIEGRKLAKVDGRCVAFDKSSRSCRLHEIFKPSRCLAIICHYADLPSEQELERRITQRQQTILEDRHGRAADQLF